MGSEDDEFVGLHGAVDFRNHVCSLDWSANLIGDTEIGPHWMARCEKAADSLTVFARHQHLGNAVNFSFSRISMPVKDVVLACGDESYGLCFSVDGRGDYGRRNCVFREKIVPGLEHSRMDQDNLAGNVSSFGKLGRAAFTDVDNWHVLHRSESRCPSD